MLLERSLSSENDSTKLYEQTLRITSALPQKSLQHGYAACCEDVALPFRTIGPFLTGLCPPDSLES